MELFTELAVGIPRIMEAAVSVCTEIGGPTMNNIGKFIKVLSNLSPEANIIGTVVNIVCTVADYLINKPKEETAVEIGIKAEKCKNQENLTPDNFDTVESYIMHLREEIKVDSERMGNLSEEERQSYAAVGMGIYIRAMEQHCGILMEPEFWRVVYKTACEQVPALIQSMKDAGIESAKILDSFLDNKVPAESENDQKMQAALTDYAKKLGKSMFSIISDMKKHYHEVEGD